METSQLHNFRLSPPGFTQNLGGGGGGGGNNNMMMIPLTDVSFSTYLKPPPEHDHLRQLKSSAAPPVLLDDSEISIFDAQKYFNESNPNPKTRSSSSFSPPQIISIHDHTNPDDHTNILPRLSSVDGYNRARSFHATPTASSEASWNSQTGLLSNPPGALAVSLRNLPSKSYYHRDGKRGGISNSTNAGGGTKWFFGRKCPCSGKKSVQVEELVVISESKKQIINHRHHQNQNLGQIQDQIIREIPNHQQRLSSSSSIHENHFPSKGFHHHRQQQRLSASGRPLTDAPGGGFSFPILHNPSLPPQYALDDPPRDSLEVFQPVDEKPVPRKAGGRGFGFPGSPISRVTATDDDMASDASSDLFEIESFSTQTTTSYPMYRRRDSLDEAQNFHATRRLSASNIYCTRRSMDEPTAPSIAPTECYEPSEASIDWSVTTAEGFERSSVTNFSISASEIDEMAMARHAWVVNNGGGGGGEGGRKKGNGVGLLMNCRHEKAVSVGPQPVKCVPVAGEHGQHGGGGGGGPAAGGGKLPLMSTFMHVSSRSGAVGASNSGSNIKPPPLARSHSARLSLAFAA